MITQEDRAVYQMVLAKGWVSKDRLDALGSQLAQAPPDLRLEALLRKQGMIDDRALAEIRQYKARLGGHQSQSGNPQQQGQQSGVRRDGPARSVASRGGPGPAGSNATRQVPPGQNAPWLNASGTGSGAQGQSSQVVPGNASQVRNLSPKDVLIGRLAIRFGLLDKETLQKCVQRRNAEGELDMDLGQYLIRVGALNFQAYQKIRTQIDGTAFCTQCSSPYPLPDGRGQKKGRCPRCAPAAAPSGAERTAPGIPPFAQKGGSGGSGGRGAGSGIATGSGGHRRPAERPGSTPQTNDAEGGLAPGEMFADYEIVEFLGDGVRSEVYRARKRGRTVALKLMATGEEGATAGEMLRLYELSEIVEAFEHKNVLPHFDVGEEDGQPYSIMAVAEGGSLAEADRKKTLNARPRLALEIISAVAQGADYTNEEGVVHGSLKPTNILFDKGDTPKISDYLTVADAYASDIEELAYMAPEQIQEGADRDGRVDVYALGVILYELTTGQLPFDASTADDLAQKILKGDPTSPRELESRIHQDVEAIILKAMSPEPEYRYEKPGAMAEDIDRYLAGKPVRAGEDLSGMAKIARRFRRNPALLYGTVAGICLLLLGTTLTGMSWYRAYAERERQKAAQNLVKEAHELAAKDPEAALDRVEKALAINTDLVGAHLVRARVRLSKGELDRALEDLETIIEKAPETVEAYELRKELHEKRGEPILEDLNELIRLTSGDEKYAYLIEKATLLESKGELDKAIETYGKASEVEPKATAPLLAVARIHRDRDRPTAALKIVEDALELDGSSTEALVMKGELLLDEDKDSEALEILDRALKKEPTHAEGLMARSKAHYRLGRFDEAIAGSRTVLRLGRDDPELRYRANLLLGFAHLDRSDLTQALEHFNKACSLLPKRGRGHFGRAEVHYRLKNYDKAREEARMAVRLEPDFMQHHTVLGKVLMAQKLYADALQAFDKAIDLAPDDVESLIQRGICYYRMDRFRDAEQDFLKATRLSEKRASPHFYLCLIYNFRDHGPIYDPVKALRHIKKAVAIDPELPYNHFQLHLAYFRNGERDKAIASLEKAIDLLPARARGLRNRWQNMLKSLKEK